MKKFSLFLLLTLLLVCPLAPPALAGDQSVPSANSGITDTNGSTDVGGINNKSDSNDAGDSYDISSDTITLTSFDEPDRTDAVAFAVGTTQDELSRWFADSVAGFIGYDADGNPYDLVSGAWSLNAVDTGTTGVYYASAVPNLEEYYALADGVSLPRQLCAVSTQTPGEPDINCCVSGRGFLRFPWVLSAGQEEQLDEFAVWMRQNDGEWTQLSDGFWFTSEDLQLSQRIFEHGSTYALKVAYPGGQTGVLTFQYDGELSIIDYSGGDRDGGDVNGGGSGTGTQPAPTLPQTPSDSHAHDNHNSGDNMRTQDNTSPPSNETPPDSVSTSQSPPSVFNEPQGERDSLLGETQPDQASMTDKPASESPAAPTGSVVQVYFDTSFFCETEGASLESGNRAVSRAKDSTKEELNPVPSINDTQRGESSEPRESAVVLESYSPTQTVISGLRLRDLCTDEESIVFGSGNLTVSIPSSLLLSLNMTDADILSVELTQPQKGRITFAVDTSGKAITVLSGTVLRLRYTPQSDNADITVRNQAGEQVADAAFDGEILRIPVSLTGTYTISESSASQSAQGSASPLLPLTGGGLLLAAGGIALSWRKRHG